MIRRFCQWYLKKFPPPLPEGRYPAVKPWAVAVTIDTESGKEVKYVNFWQDRLFRWMGDDDWTRAKDFALSKVDYIKNHGFTEVIDDLETWYPVKRIHLVQAFPLELEQGEDIEG